MSDAHGKGVSSARALMLAHDREPTHAMQVRRNALVLFDQTMQTHELDGEARDLLEAAAFVHDTGYSVNPKGHHKGSRDLVLQHGLPGFTDRQTLVIACIARYHRKAFPQPNHKGFRDLSPQDQYLVTRLAALLRVADGLDRCHISASSIEDVEITPDRLKLRVHQSRANSMDIEGVLKKRALFEQVFGLKVSVEVFGPTA